MIYRILFTGANMTDLMLIGSKLLVTSTTILSFKTTGTILFFTNYFLFRLGRLECRARRAGRPVCDRACL
jgi:hypothetical protein